MSLLLDEVNKIEAEKVAQIAILLISKASGCIIQTQIAICSTIFRVVHFSPASRESGDEPNLGGVSELALQLLLDSGLKKQLHNKADARKQSTASSQEVYVWQCGSKPS